uniref:Uncharacterized protein n=1 Tax=Timema poppense TaxID=170557 RepID=A0A7R9CKB8_TIMPO|nr:unnamed protein product [Timema poppensis]
MLFSNVSTPPPSSGSVSHPSRVRNPQVGNHSPKRNGWDPAPSSQTIQDETDTMVHVFTNAVDLVSFLEPPKYFPCKFTSAR